MRRERGGHAEHAPAGFFLLRAPALPFETLARWSPGDDARAEGPVLATLRARLHELLRRPDVREAIFLASPAVEARISPWMEGAVAAAEAEKLERAYVRYLQRMCWRTTPFGLFAGIAVGTIGACGAGSRLALAGPEHRGRHTRIDSELLDNLRRRLVRDPAVRAALRYHPTSHLFVRGGDVVFVGPRGDRAGHRVRTVPRTAALAHVLELATGGSTAGALAAGLCAAGLAPDGATAAQLVDALVETGLLIDPLEPPVVGADELTHLADRLDAVAAGGELRRTLLAIQDELRDLDGAGAPRSYRRADAALRARAGLEEPGKEVPRLFQVVMRHAATELELDERVTHEVLRGASALAALAPAAANPLAELARAFEARFAEREVALLEALDEVAGIGFDPRSSTIAEVPALLRGLALPAGEAEAPAVWGPRERWLAERVVAAARTGHDEIEISAQELSALPTPRAALPDSFSASVALHAESLSALNEDRYRVHVRRVLGPTGASLLGRFCGSHPALAEHVRALVAREADLAGDAITAEIVHRPHPSSGNVMSRPALRDVEIAVLGGSSSSGATRLPLADLVVSVVDGAVRLGSRTLGRRVLPRLSCSDNTQLPGLPVYRFLTSVARAEGATSLHWDWGALAHLPELPRVVHGRCILALARWRFDAATLAALGAASGPERQAMLDELRRRRRIPRWVMLCRRDLNLPIDWTHPLSVEAFLAAGDEGGAIVEEMFPGPGGPFVDGADGRYAAELVVPFLRTRARQVAAPASVRAPIPPDRPERRSRPGGAWLYAKLYCNERAADSVLRDVVYPLVAEQAGAFDRWFFLRYGDPAWHLRVRFHGPPAALRGELLPALEHLIGRFDGERWIHRVTFDTYDPEWERYGGPDAMPIVEALFHHDSDAALGAAIAYPGDSEARWQLALRGMHRAMVQLVPDAEARLRIARAARHRYAAQFGLLGRAGRALGKRFREQQARVAEVLGDLPDAHPLRLGVDLLDERDRRWSSLVPALWSALPRSSTAAERDALEARIVISLAHVHANRILATEHRLQEAVLCSFLERVFGTELARARGNPAQGQGRKKSA